jgi:hypothetical protein
VNGISKFFGCVPKHPEPPKIAAGGVGVGGSNPLVPTNWFFKRAAIARWAALFALALPRP